MTRVVWQCHVLFVLQSQVKTQCSYMKPAKYPDIYLSGLRISKIGNSSLTYQTSLFAAKDENSSFSGGNLVLGNFKDELDVEAHVLNHFEDTACCTGEYIHVFVNPKKGNTPSKISDEWRDVLKRLQ